MEDRPGLTELIEAIAGNGVRLVLVENADRLARKLFVNELILAEMRKLGVRVIAADGGTELTADEGEDDPTKVLVRQILAAIAEFDKKLIVRKLRKARERIRRNSGRCEGRKPYGEREGERDVLDKINAMYREKPQPTFDEIAGRLNADGIPTRTGKDWTRGIVWSILRRGA